ncbi:MAG TPA: hypothetical protein VHV78_06900 [Gemmatimonadaceae bacterium]|nr:hypothetical protein [Gemmatimonadaceae bacterium]
MPSANLGRSQSTVRRTPPPAMIELPPLPLVDFVVDFFVEQLAELPTHAWLEIGRAVDSAGRGASSRRAALSVLQTAAARQDVVVAAWFVRDAVETAASIARGATMARWSRENRRAFSAARAAAEHAALALLLSRRLPVADHRALVAPFAALLADRAPSATYRRTLARRARPTTSTTSTTAAAARSSS